MGPSNQRRAWSLVSCTVVLFVATTGRADPTLKVGAGVRSCAQFRRDYQANMVIYLPPTYSRHPCSGVRLSWKSTNL